MVSLVVLFFLNKVLGWPKRFTCEKPKWTFWPTQYMLPVEQLFLFIFTGQQNNVPRPFSVWGSFLSYAANLFLVSCMLADLIILAISFILSCQRTIAFSRIIVKANSELMRCLHRWERSINSLHSVNMKAPPICSSAHVVPESDTLSKAGSRLWLKLSW